MSQLTPKQQQIYDYILTFADEHGYPPSVREIAEAVDLKSPSTVHFHLKGLRAAGLISQAEGKTRAITINSGLVHGRKDQVPVVGNVAAGSPILAEECIEDYLTFDTDRRAFRPEGAWRIHAQRGHPARGPGGGPSAAVGAQRRHRGGAV